MIYIQTNYVFFFQEKMVNIKLEQQKDSKQKVSLTEISKLFCEACDGIFRPVVEASINLQQAKIWNNLR